MSSTRYSCRILTKQKSSNINFHENSSKGSPVVPRGQTDMTKPIVAFRNFATAPKNHQIPEREASWVVFMPIRTLSSYV